MSGNNHCSLQLGLSTNGSMNGVYRCAIVHLHHNISPSSVNLGPAYCCTCRIHPSHNHAHSMSLNPYIVISLIIYWSNSASEIQKQLSSNQVPLSCNLCQLVDTLTPRHSEIRGVLKFSLTRNDSWSKVIFYLGRPTLEL